MHDELLVCAHARSTARARAHHPSNIPCYTFCHSRFLHKPIRHEQMSRACASNVHRSITNFVRSLFIVTARSLVHFSYTRVYGAGLRRRRRRRVAANQIGGAEIILIWSDFLLVSRLRSPSPSSLPSSSAAHNSFTADNCDVCISALAVLSPTRLFMIFQSSEHVKD